MGCELLALWGRGLAQDALNHDTPQPGMVHMADITAGEKRLEWTTGQRVTERITGKKNHTESARDAQPVTLRKVAARGRECYVSVHHLSLAVRRFNKGPGDDKKKARQKGEYELSFSNGTGLAVAPV